MFAQISEARSYLRTWLDRLLYGHSRSRRVPDSLFASKQREYLEGIRLAVEAHERTSEKLAGAISVFEGFIYENVKADEVSIGELREFIRDGKITLEHWVSKTDNTEAKSYWLHFADPLEEHLDYIEKNWSAILERGSFINEPGKP
jgi:hypothetical protein